MKEGRNNGEAWGTGLIAIEMVFILKSFPSRFREKTDKLKDLRDPMWKEKESAGLMQSDAMEQMRKTRRSKTVIQVIWLLGLAAMLAGLAYGRLSEADMPRTTSMTGALGLILLIAYFIWIMRTLWELSASKAEAEQALVRSLTLIQCVTELSANRDVDAAIHHLLEIMDFYFKGDRTYIFEIDEERQVVHNSYEYTAHGISKEVDNLDELPLQIIASWIEKFREEGSFYISNLDQEKGREDERIYECLKAQNIESLIAVPLVKGHNMVGFLGVDNPRECCLDFSFLSSVQFFIMNRLDTKMQQEELELLSYRDALTNLYNRNRYIRVLENDRQRKGQAIQKIGVAYMDLNGLKKINDELGHEAGDSLIRQAAQQIVAVFPEHAYRIGGDEFVVIYPDVEERQFAYLITQLQHNAKDHQVSLSYGIVWEEVCMDLEVLLKQADHEMYEDKKRYYSSEQYDRRRSGKSDHV